MLKVYFAKNQDSRSRDVASWFKEKRLSHLIKSAVRPQTADLILTAGGDGALLDAIRRYGRYGRPFFGINRGTSGVLLNRITSRGELAAVLKKFSACQLVKLYLLKGEIFSSRTKKVIYAFNDFYLKSARGNERIMGTIQGGPSFNKQNFDGDGIIISSPQGSTAYNQAAGGRVLPLKSGRLAVKSICSRQPVNASVFNRKITVKVSRGRAVAYADHSRASSGVKKMTVQLSRRAVSLAFKSGYDFETSRQSTAKRHER